MNPADRLAAMLDAWAISKTARPFDVRGGQREDAGLTTWREQAAAVELVREVERAIDGLDAAGDDTSAFRPYLPTWYAAVFAADTGFNQSSNPIPAVDSYALQTLRMLGVLLNRLAPERVIPQTDREAISALLQEAYDTVTETAELDDRSKIALAGLVRAAQHVLGRLDFAGAGDLRTRVSELSMALASHASRLAQEDPGSGNEGVRARMLRLAQALASKVLTAGAGAAVVELATEGTKAITGG